MLFHTPLFVLGFLPLCLGGVFALGRLAGPRLALGWLVCCSVGFYGWWNPVYVPLLVGSIVGNWIIGRRPTQATVERDLIGAIFGWLRRATAHIPSGSAQGQA